MRYPGSDSALLADYDNATRQIRVRFDRILAYEAGGDYAVLSVRGKGSGEL